MVRCVEVSGPCIYQTRIQLCTERQHLIGLSGDKKWTIFKNLFLQKCISIIIQTEQEDLPKGMDFMIPAIEVLPSGWESNLE
jgi:hypothetical protein